jgi:hypothetical protein
MTKMVRTYPELIAEKDARIAELEREIVTLMNFLMGIKYTTDLALMAGTLKGTE